jgi:hypothetical protein
MCTKRTTLGGDISVTEIIVIQKEGVGDKTSA